MSSQEYQRLDFLELMEGFHCADPGCSTCALLDMPPEGEARGAWTAAIRAELAAAPPSVKGRKAKVPDRWSVHYSRCAVCGSTETRHCANGRCTRCDWYWRKNGTDRPERLWNMEKAS